MKQNRLILLGFSILLSLNIIFLLTSFSSEKSNEQEYIAVTLRPKGFGYHELWGVIVYYPDGKTEQFELYDSKIDLEGRKLLTAQLNVLLKKGYTIVSGSGNEFILKR